MSVRKWHQINPPYSHIHRYTHFAPSSYTYTFLHISIHPPQCKTYINSKNLGIFSDYPKELTEICRQVHLSLVGQTIM